MNTITCRVCGYKSLINHMQTRLLTDEEAAHLPRLPVPTIRYRAYACPACERWEAVRREFEVEEEMR
jgi:DNA-directed RNA polymerase subunit RPC12/RpoP